MNSAAYLSYNHFRRHNPELFRVALLAYDRLYIDYDLAKIKFGIFPSLFDRPALSPSEAADLLAEWPDSTAISLALYLEDDPGNLRLLRDRAAYVRREPDPVLREFFEMCFPAGVGIPIFHAGLFRIVAEVYRQRGFDVNEDPFVRADLAMAVQEFFVSYFLSRHLGVATVMSDAELAIRDLLRRLPPLPLSQPEFPNPVFGRFCPITHLQEMLDAESPGTFVATQRITTIAVPQLRRIPLREVLKIRKKDRVRSLAAFAESLWHRADGDPIRLVSAYADELWKVARRLNPSVGEMAVNVMGNVPLPIPINPLGIAGTIGAIRGRTKLKADAGWFFVLGALADQTR